ncbi:MAG: lysophospholipid acyltransferase family protein [Rhodocyclaceae bacterium]
MFNIVRSIVFALVIIALTLPFAFIALASAPFPPQTRYRWISGWAKMMMRVMPVVLGIRHRVIGRENITDSPAVILCKHQSAWETIAMQQIFPPVAFVLKRELLRIPFFGWGLAQMPIVSIDRSAGRDALAQVVEQGKQRLAEGFWVVVFPEGTRAAVGTARRYKVGGATLACEAGVPVIPVAHNAGEFWRRNAFVKSAGEIVVSIGPVIDTQGRTPEEVNTLSEAWIESEMQRLFPHHYKGQATRIVSHAEAGTR